MSAPDPARIALERELDAARARVADLEARTGLTIEPPIAAGTAAWSLGVTIETARKRAQRGAGFKLNGQWHFPRSYVEAHRRRAEQSK